MPEPIPFAPHPDCTACPLYANAKSPGIPCRPSDSPLAPSPKPKALLIVGEAPGREEDLAAKPFVGPSGLFLHRIYIGALALQDHADIYLTNACRCRPVKNATPTRSQINRCQPHLLADIHLLQQHYADLTILCVGSAATHSVLGCTLDAAFRRQGKPQEWGWAGTESLLPVPVFATFHPANLLPGRQANRLAPIKDHLALLHAHLSGTTRPRPEAPTYTWNPPASTFRRKRFSRLSLDIETYGACSQFPPQTCFHPAKSRHYDQPSRLICTVAVCGRSEKGDLECYAWDWSDYRNTQSLLACLRALSGDLVGMNLKFDLLYLRADDPLLASTLTPDIMLTDLSVLNYLHSEQRPERSLKSIAPLLGITDYDESRSLKHYRYPSPTHPDLIAYNVKDAWATLQAVEVLEARIRKDYPGSDKLTDYARRWYSNVIWSCLRMEEDGIAFSQSALDDLDFSLVLKNALLYSRLRHKHDLLVCGPGSEKCIRDLYTQAVEACDLAGDPRVELTPKKGLIATNQRNANLLLQCLPADSPLSNLLRLQQEWEGNAKIVTSYTRPMLHGTNRSPVSNRLAPTTISHRSRPNTLIAYPSWFPVPAAQDSGQEGGTIQGRITSKGPACQTLPKIVKKCLTTRFDPGFLLCVDLSQIEMRIAALLSGDPLMLKEYREGVDRHTQTALRIIQALSDWMEDTDRDAVTLCGNLYTCEELSTFCNTPSPRSLPRFDLFRQMGKTENFLTIYGGSPKKLQGTVAQDLGVSLPIEVCADLIATDRERYGGLAWYQDALVRQAVRDLRIEMPLIGASRVFLGSKRGIEETYRSEILNFPIQWTAACVMLDLQFALVNRLNRRRRRVYCGLNTYDSLTADGPLSEYEPTVEAIRGAFARSDFLDRLSDRLGRTVPLGYDITVLVKDSLASTHLPCVA